MNLSYSKGTISKMMIVNVLLAVLIVSAIVVLFFTDEKEDSPTFARSPTPENIAKTLRPTTATTANAQTEIDTLKKQLERETSKLDTLREDEKRVEAIRKASELEAAKLADAQAVPSQDEPPEPDQNKVEDSARKGSETKAETASKNAVE